MLSPLLISFPFLIFLKASSVVSPPPPAPPLKPLYAWTQVIGETELCVKAIMESPVLPDLRVDGLSFTMYQRPPPKGQKNAFPVYVFEAHIPITADSVVLEGQPLPVLKPKTEKLAVLGDTGCRITKTTAQACKDPKAWPFATVAKSIAQYQPDLIIHTGDYYYREAPCPLPELCGGSPYGDNWDTWRADWFEPAAPLFRTAPLILTRGNHETCHRGGQGWSYFLGHASNTSCEDFEPPYLLALNTHNVMVFDSSYGSDRLPVPGQIKKWKEAFLRALPKADQPLWLLTHRPLWADLESFLHIEHGNFPQRKAFSDIFPQNLSLILSGHVHMAQILKVKDRPVQMIIGHGGTLLDHPGVLHKTYENAKSGGIAQSQVIPGFGFALVSYEHEEAHWNFYDKNGKKLEEYFIGDNRNIVKK